MRIAVDLRPLLGASHGGVTVYIRGLLQALEKEKVKLDLFYFARHPDLALHEEFPKLRFLKLSTWGFYLRWLMGFAFLPKGFFPKEPDLIWIPDRRPFFKSSIPLVLTVHDLVPELCPRSLSRKARLWHFLFPLKKLLHPCAGFLTPSSSAVRKLRTGIPHGVTYEGVSLESEQVPSAKLPKNYFLMIAPADPRKRLDWFFSLAEAFPKESFVWLGRKGKETRFKKENWSIPKNVWCLGEVNEGEKTWLLKHCRALLAISKEEGFDLPALEALTLKKPVIMSEIPVHHELYKHFSPLVSNFEDLKLSFRRVLEGKFKTPQIRGKYSWENAARLSLAFFQRVISDKDRNTGADRNC